MSGASPSAVRVGANEPPAFRVALVRTTGCSGYNDSARASATLNGAMRRTGPRPLSCDHHTTSEFASAMSRPVTAKTSSAPARTRWRAAASVLPWLAVAGVADRSADRSADSADANARVESRIRARAKDKAGVHAVIRPELFESASASSSRAIATSSTASASEP